MLPTQQAGARDRPKQLEKSLTPVWQTLARAGTGVTLPSMEAFMLAIVTLGNWVAIKAAAPAEQRLK